jgi:uncharacterized membrane protein
MAAAHPMLKTMTYGVMHLTVAFLVAYAITRDWRVALGISLIEPAVQTVAYFYHEKLWQRLSPTTAASPVIRRYLLLRGRRRVHALMAAKRP